MPELATVGQVNAGRSMRELTTTLTMPPAASDTLMLASFPTSAETLLLLRGIPASDVSRRDIAEPITDQSRIGVREQDQIPFRQTGGKTRPASAT